LPQAAALLNLRVQVWWSGDAKYFAGTVVEYDGTKHSVKYDDGDLVKHDLMTPGVESFMVESLEQ